MEGAHILDGDYVLVHPQHTAANGEIVVALIGDEATVKRFYRTDRGITLKAENPKFEPIEIERSEAHILQAHRASHGCSSHYEEMMTATDTGQLIVYVLDDPMMMRASPRCVELVDGHQAPVLIDASQARTCWDFED